MDPDECLKEMLKLVHLIYTTTNPSDIEGYAADLAEHVEALNEWLSTKGFLPLAWSDQYKAILDGKEIVYRMPKAFDPRSEYVADE